MTEVNRLTNSIFRKDVNTDSFVFRCFYKGSFWILTVSSIILFLKQYFGYPIHCKLTGPVDNSVSLGCFFTKTFKLLNMTDFGYSNKEPDNQNYYQWVPFILLAQAFLFRIPYWIWKDNGGYRISKWIDEPVSQDEVIHRLYTHRNWTIWLIICQILNLINLSIQIYLTNSFLQGKFINIEYGKDDLETVLPKQIKCTWQQFGASGVIQLYSTVCVVTINYLNENIFKALWFWYIVLACLSILEILWRIITFIFHKNITFNMWVFTSVGLSKKHNFTQVEKIAKHTNYREWLLIYHLSEHIKIKDFSVLSAGLGPQNSEEMQMYSDLRETDKID